MRSGEIIRPENCSKVWVKTRWLWSRVMTVGSGNIPSRADEIDRCEMPWLAASRLKSASHALKSPPQGAARAGPQTVMQVTAIQVAASAIEENQVRMDCMIGPAIKSPAPPRKRIRTSAGVPFRVRFDVQPWFWERQSSRIPRSGPRLS
jgi:hypothetical protein